MKKLTNFIYEAEKPKFEVQDDSLNYISKKQLEDYLDIASKSLSEEAKNICQWLIDNNSNYIKDLGGNANNALAAFYNRGIPSDEKYKDLYKWIGKVIKSGRILEIPVFQSKEQFNDIISKNVAPDEIIMDLETEKGRNLVAKKYSNLVYKIAQEFIGKSNLDMDELYAYGLLGLTSAMNEYGRPLSQNKENQEKKIQQVRKKAEENDIDPDEAEKEYLEKNKEASKYKKLSFAQYAGWRIRLWILGGIEDSHTVRIPKSVQGNLLYGISGEFKDAIDDGRKIVKSNIDWDYLNEEDRELLKSLGFTKKDYEDINGNLSEYMKILKANLRNKGKQGFIAKNYNISGDEKIGGDEQEGGKTIWDVIGDKQSAWSNIDKEETNLAKKKLLDAIHKKVGDRNFAWIENALKDDDDETKLEVKEIAKKYGVSMGSISTVASKSAIQKLVLKDPELKKLAYDWYQKFEESLHDEIENTIDFTQPIYLSYLH